MSYVLEFPVSVGVARWYDPNSEHLLLGETPASGFVVIPEGMTCKIIISESETLDFLRDFPPVPIAHLTVEFRGYVDLASLGSLSRLQRLTLVGKGIQQHNPGLRSIEWSALSRLTELEELDLRGIPLQFADMSGLSVLPRLKCLKINRTDTLNVQLGALGQLPELQTLDVTDTDIAPTSLPQLYGLPRLRELSVSGRRFADQSAGFFTPFEGLKSLKIYDAPITDAFIENILARCNITDLTVDVSISGAVTGRGFDVLNSTPLKSVSLWDAAIDAYGLNALCRHDTLESVCIGATYPSQKDFSTRPIRNLSLLKHLRIADIECVTDVFCYLESLETLGISHTKIPADVYAEIGNLEHLASLSLSGVLVPDKTISAWKNLGKLKSLALFGTETTSSGLTELKGCTSLEYLGLGSLVLSNEAIDALSKLPNLVHFLTTMVNADVNILDSLCRLQNLRYFATDSYLIPPDALDFVQKRLPNCTISHWQM